MNDIAYIQDLVEKRRIAKEASIAAAKLENTQPSIDFLYDLTGKFIAEMESLREENSQVQAALMNIKVELATALANLVSLQQILDVSRETEKQLRLQLAQPNNNEALLETNAELQGRLDGEREARAKADSIIQQTLNRFDDLIKMMAIEEIPEPISYKLDIKRDGNNIMRDVRLIPEKSNG